MSAFKSFLVLISFFIIISNTLFAQDKGTLTGSVVDKDNGEPLIGATVLVVGTKLGAKADVKGNFRIRNITVGKVTLRVSYVGYQTKALTDVEIIKGDNKPITISLSPQATTTEDVVVEARRIDDNAVAMLVKRKNAEQVSDGVSREEIQKLPDSDAGQALKRVTGVTLVDNKFIFVRGVSERYSNTTLNGAALTSTEPDKKAFSFDMFPSEFLENVNIAKSFTPDLPGNFAGGLVQLNTVDFPSSRILKFSMSSFANTNVNFVGDEYFSTPSSSTDWLGYDDGMRSLPNSVPGVAEFNALRTDPSRRDEYDAVSKSFNGNNWNKTQSSISPLDNRGFNLSYSDYVDLDDEGQQLGLVTSINYANSYGLNTIDRNWYSSNFDTFYTYQGAIANRSINMGGMVNIAYRLNPENTISFKNVFNRSADDESLFQEGKDLFYQYKEYKNNSFQFVQKELFNSSIGGTHALNSVINGLTADWRVGYSVSNRDEPDFRRLKYSRNISDVEFDPTTPFLAELGTTQQGDGTQAGRFFSNLEDDVINGLFNVSIPVESWLKFKTGLLYEKRNRSFGARSMTVKYNARNLRPEIDELMRDWQNPHKLFDAENFDSQSGLQMAEDSKLSDSYSATEELFAYYFMGDVSFNLAGEEFRFIGGARIEDNSQLLDSYNINQEKVNVDLSRVDVLPSINFVWKASENANLRMSATQTLTRPSLREFAPFSFYDYNIQMLVQGNPNLDRTLIQNYDMRFEYFPELGEVYSIGVFYKSFENAIEETVYPQQSELTKTFVNADGTARNLGVELEFRKKLGFISSYLDNLMFTSNISLIDSEIEVNQGNVTDTRQMWGQSPYAINLGLFYILEETGTTFNVGYNRYGRRIIQVGRIGNFESDDPHIYELPRDLVDISISQSIENFDIKLAIRDLLNQQLVWQQDQIRANVNNNYVVATNLRGTSINLSMSYRIF